ncbi:MAG TPA: hypothetical protein VNK73_05335 [Actinomycetota bacterium]|jgi:hypothetical protein|nr:hypothetical protein [Actinomycetota bacterium]
MTNAQDHPAAPSERGATGSRPQLPPVPPPSRGRPVYRRLWTAVVLTLLFATGIWFGRLVDFSEPAVARVTPTPLTTIVTVPGRAPSSCVSALDRGDAAIQLLVKGVRDQRLTGQLKSYLKAANACRKDMPSR